jgi:hypothetical protein
MYSARKQRAELHCSRSHLYQQWELLPSGQKHPSKQQHLLLTLRHLLWLTQQLVFSIGPCCSTCTTCTCCAC